MQSIFCSQKQIRRWLLKINLTKSCVISFVSPHPFPPHSTWPPTMVLPGLTQQQPPHSYETHFNCGKGRRKIFFKKSINLFCEGMYWYEEEDVMCDFSFRKREKKWQIFSKEFRLRVLIFRFFYNWAGTRTFSSTYKKTRIKYTAARTKH